MNSFYHFWNNQYLLTTVNSYLAGEFQEVQWQFLLQFHFQFCKKQANLLLGQGKQSQSWSEIKFSTFTIYLFLPSFLIFWTFSSFWINWWKWVCDLFLYSEKSIFIYYSWILESIRSQTKLIELIEWFKMISVRFHNL